MRVTRRRAIRLMTAGALCCRRWKASPQVGVYPRARIAEHTKIHRCQSGGVSRIFSPVGL
jgi:hypothetical protein